MIGLIGRIRLIGPMIRPISQIRPIIGQVIRPISQIRPIIGPISPIRPISLIRIAAFMCVASWKLTPRY